MSSSMKPMTLWVWPAGMFPRRVLYYFKAKQLPASLLRQLTIVPVEIDTQKGTLDALPKYDARPVGYSLPVLRFNEDGQESGSTFITQSSSILEYFEELFPPADGYINLAGQDAASRARMRDVIFLVNEVFVWTNVYLRHSTELSRSWTGMTREQQSQSAADDARKQVVKFMKTLEERVGSLIRLGNVSILGGSLPNLADFNLHASKAYIFEMYGWNIFEGRDLLEEWFARYQASRWGITQEDMAKFEKGDFEDLFIKE